MESRILTAAAVTGALLFVWELLGAGLQPAPHTFMTADAILVEKSSHRMSLFRDGQVVRTYRVALGRGGSGPKSRQGDRRTPEGIYYIDRHNASSCCHLALHISYPNAADIAAARTSGVSAGSDIEIHGLPRGERWLGSWRRARDWTSGCIAVTDREIEEIWSAVPDGTPIMIRH